MRLPADFCSPALLRHTLAWLAHHFSNLIYATAFCATLLPFAHAQPARTELNGTKPLLIYFVDVEGGQATLLVAPSGASMLVDAGWPGFDGRDALRVEAAMHDAGITRIDHVLITHFHLDHVGGVPELVKRVPVGEFLDHGPNREDSEITRRDYAAYMAAIQGKPRRIVRPGDSILIPGLDAIVLTADGEHIAAIPGIKPVPNPYCAAEPAWPTDDTEEARSAGILVTFGHFRFIDLGDLTKAKEVALVCPANPIGTVDLYLAAHPAFNQSNARALVDALRPIVAVMNNGAHKAASPEVWQTIHKSPGLQDLWQLHTAEDSDAAHNSSADLIANPRGGGDGAYIKVAAAQNGSFSVTNSRNSLTKQYPAVR
jgi:beta-lactamase superfamily II metal-dependent hydrolase